MPVSTADASYEHKLALAKHALITHCRESITEHWNGHFDMWLSLDADLVFCQGYVDKFQEQFSQYMNDDIESLLWHTGHNIQYALGAFMKYKDSPELDDVLDYTELFIKEQIGDIDNWCDAIGQAMYEETSEYERENGDTKEDNPY